MKTTYYAILRLVFSGLVIITAFMCNPGIAAAVPKRVAVLPFKINAEKDLSFLRNGIVDMLASRLSWEDKVTVLSREETAKALETVASPITEGSAREIGTRLGVDYVLFGSLTVFGNSVSIDAKMVDISGSKPPLTFFNQSQQMDQVIPDINLFATDINDKIFGRVMPARQVYAPSQPAQEQTDLRTHPEKLFTEGFGGMDEDQPQRASPGSGFMATQEASGRSAQFWKSQSFKTRISGIAIGDVDRDGKQETIIITPHTVEIYRFEQKRFFKVNTIAEHKDDNFIGVDVADINGNGYPEIFVSSLNPLRNTVNSFVLEFNGQTYVEIVKNDSWCYRVVESPSRGTILLGEKESIKGPFWGKIFEMAWEKSGYEPTNPVHLRDWRAQVMGLAVGNAMNDGSEVMVAFDPEDYLRLYDLTGNEIWKEGHHSGGGTEYYVISSGGSADDEKRGYYPVRIVIRDINRDGKNEVITLKNERLSELLSYRKFTQGNIEIRVWDGVGLAVHWRTRQLSGYYSDFAVGDFDNDGKDELVAALVIRSGDVVTTEPKSTVIAYELE